MMLLGCPGDVAEPLPLFCRWETKARAFVMVGGGSQRPSLSSRAVWKGIWYEVPFVPRSGLLHIKIKS